MKRTLLIITTCAFALAFTGQLQAQDKPERPERKGRAEKREHNRLTQEQRDRLRAAHEKAAEDPKVKAAAEQLRTAADEMRSVAHAALLKTDPSLAPVLKKLQEVREERQEKREAGERPRDIRKGPPQDRGVLSDEERKQLRAARQTIKDDPAVAAAREKTGEASKALHEARREAVLAVDPSLEPLLKEMRGRGFGHGHKGIHKRGKGPREGKRDKAPEPANEEA